MQITSNMYHELSQKITKIEKYLETAPEGHMKINQRRKRSVYYHMTPGSADSTRKQRYLRKGNEEDEKLKEELAKKQYYQKLLPVLKEEQKALKDFLKAYKPEEKYQIYDKLSESRKILINPEFKKIEDIVNEWEAEKWTPSEKYSEGLKYETNCRELVRSKSEVIIADALFHNEEYCVYRYEAPLYIPELNGFIYPDFTIMKKSTGEIFYWEHFGMMGDESYVDSFLYKINLYNMIGIYMGKQLICTFESERRPLDTRIVRNIIQEYFM